MSPVIPAVLLSAFLHAAWNAYLHGIKDKEWQLAIIAAIYVALALAGCWWLPLPATASWPFIAASATSQVAYSFLLIHSYKRGHFGNSYPIARGTSPLVVALGAYLFAGEQLHPMELLGICLIAFGVTSLAFEKSYILAGNVLPAVGTGILIAVCTLIDGFGVRSSGNSFSYISWMYLICYGTILIRYLWMQGGRALIGVPPGVLAKGTAVGLMSFVAYTLIIWALSRAPMGMLAALRELSGPMAIVLAWMILRERPSLFRIFACTVAAAGGIVLRS